MEEDKMLTTLAFILGYILIDNLSSTEQNALGNWLMLVSQTLCTNGSYTFNKEDFDIIIDNDFSINTDRLVKEFYDKSIVSR